MVDNWRASGDPCRRTDKYFKGKTVFKLSSKPNGSRHRNTLQLKLFRETRVLHLAFIFIQARGRCTSPPNPCSKPAQARSGCTTPPPALLVSSSCTTHHPLPQSLNIHHPQLTFRPWEMHHPPQLCPSKVGGGAPPPPSCAHPRWGGYTTPPTSTPSRGEIF